MRQHTQPQPKVYFAFAKSLATSAKIAALAIGLSAFAATAHAADRVGNGNGRTVELALSKLNEKVPGVDAFHKILYAFENGTKIDVAASEGLWSGVVMTYDNAMWGGKLATQEAGRLAFKTVSQGPLLDPIEAGDWESYEQFSDDFDLRWATQRAVEFNGRSLVLQLLYPSRTTIEVRSYRGTLVGIARPLDDGQCEFKTSMTQYSVQMKEPNVCGVFYLFKHKPFPIRPKNI
jgi:hypothetical protein